MLDKEVFLNGEEWSYEKYEEQVHSEQLGSILDLADTSKDWSVPDSLKDKVQADGSFAPFFGDTTVFTLSPKEISEISFLVDKVESSIKFLAEPLDRRQFHLTLHDLSNSREEEKIMGSMKNNEIKVKSIFGRISNEIEKTPDLHKIDMLSTNIYPSSNSSLLLGFMPKTELDYKKLYWLFNLFQEVVPLSFWLRPHVTLGYYDRNKRNSSEISLLSRTLKELNPPEISLQLDIKNLCYQHFFNMNNYKTVFKI